MKRPIARKELLTFVSTMLVCGIASAQQSGADVTGIPTPRTQVPERVGGMPEPGPTAGGTPSGASQNPGGVPMGPFTAYPSVGYEVQRNDNIFLQAPNSNLVKHDTIQVLKPAVRVEGKQDANIYRLDFGGAFGRYSSSTADNYNNNNASASADFNTGGRLTLRLRGDHVDQHDPRGSTNDPLALVPNRYRQETLGGVLGYGAPGARGRLELELGGMDKHYYNNRATTSINDRNDRTIGGTFYWRVAPRTSLLAQVRRTNIDFTDPTVILDSTDTRILGGVTWEATAATTGVIKVGQEKKDFKNSAVGDFTGSTWEAQVHWTPLTYSRWDFNTSKYTRETTGAVGNFILGSTYGASWNHNWTSQFMTTTTASYATDDYQGISRKDKISNLGLRGTYQMRRWISFGADYSWSKRDSNVATADYTRNIFMLFVNATL